MFFPTKQLGLRSSTRQRRVPGAAAPGPQARQTLHRHRALGLERWVWAGRSGWGALIKGCGETQSSAMSEGKTHILWSSFKRTLWDVFIPHMWDEKESVSLRPGPQSKACPKCRIFLAPQVLGSRGWALSHLPVHRLVDEAGEEPRGAEQLLPHLLQAPLLLAEALWLHAGQCCPRLQLLHGPLQLMDLVLVPLALQLQLPLRARKQPHTWPRAETGPRALHRGCPPGPGRPGRALGRDCGHRAELGEESGEDGPAPDELPSRPRGPPDRAQDAMYVGVVVGRNHSPSTPLPLQAPQQQEARLGHEALCHPLETCPPLRRNQATSCLVPGTSA